MTEVHIDIEELVPHRPPMRLVDELCEVKGDTAVTRSVVTENWPMCENGRVDVILMIEIIAQSVSAMTGWQQLDEDEHGGRGLLVGIKKAEFFAEYVDVSACLNTRVELCIKTGNYRVFEGEVKEGSRVVARATLQAYRPEGGDIFA